MKILTIHSDFIEVEPKTKALKSAEEIKKAKQRIEDCLVVFTAVEEGDKDNIADNTAHEIMSVAEQVKAKKIVLYPFVHLTNKPAEPTAALSILKKIESLLKNYEVYRAPFGWYKVFTIKCKGHPLAELSREIKDTEEKVAREKVTEKIKSEYLILTPEGKEIKLNLKKIQEVEDFLNKNQALKKYIYSEEIKGIPSKEPPSIKAMQSLEMVGYASASDPGNFNLFPKGHLIFELLKEWAYEIAVKRFGSIQIDTPILYDWGQPDIRAQGESFHEKHYSVIVPDHKRELVLRFAGDFGLFSIMKNATLSYKNLPLRIYEFSKSFRYETRGELTGLKRLRAFHMPDIHSFCADIDQGWNEYEELYKNYDDLAKSTGIEYAVVFRIVEDFYKKYKNRIVKLLKYSKKPAFIELLTEMKHYWAVKHEFQGIDSVGGNLQLSTVQLDVKDAAIYGITYTDKNNRKTGCIICHSSIGSIERWFYSILEHALQSKNPVLPMWLSPVQVRLCPINDSLLQHCEKIADELSKEQIRTDIDDRVESVQKKVRDAEIEWIPLIVVVGEKEKKSGKLAVRFRETGKVESMKSAELIKLIKKQTKEYPFKPLPLPLFLTKRPIFVG